MNSVFPPAVQDISVQPMIASVSLEVRCRLQQWVQNIFLVRFYSWANDKSLLSIDGFRRCNSICTCGFMVSCKISVAEELS